MPFPIIYIAWRKAHIEKWPSLWFLWLPVCCSEASRCTWLINSVTRTMLRDGNCNLEASLPVFLHSLLSHWCSGENVENERCFFSGTYSRGHDQAIIGIRIKHHLTSDFSGVRIICPADGFMQEPPVLSILIPLYRIIKSWLDWWSLNPAAVLEKLTPYKMYKTSTESTGEDDSTHIQSLRRAAFYQLKLSGLNIVESCLLHLCS